MTDDLVAFLRARLDEDEQAARKAPPGPWVGTDDESIGAWSVYDQEWQIASATVYTHDQPMGQRRGPGYIDASATAAHIARHDPARVLREVEGKRRMVDECERAVEYDSRGVMSMAEDFLRLLALPYVGHPDYRKEWRP